MIALAKQRRLHMLALLYALYALEQIIVNPLANHRIFSVIANTCILRYLSISCWF